MYKSYFDSFSDLKFYFEQGMLQVERDHYILFNSLTNRKLFFSEEEPFLKYKPMIDNPNFWRFPDAREINQEYNKSKSEVQRKSQNYRIQGSAADCSKLAGIIFFNQLIQRDWIWKVKIVNMVHDRHTCRG